MTATRLARWVVIASLAAGAGLHVAVAASSSVAWQNLSAAQKQVLAPLEHDWATLEPSRRQKWLEVAARFPAMPAEERARVQERMAEWARLSPSQRAQARMQFQEVRQLPAEERQAKWQAYQALTDDEKRQLAQRARPASKPASVSEANPLSKAAQPGPQAAAASNGRAVAPIVVQARPGATTTTMTVKPLAPKHLEPAGPKIAATSNYVDPATLLPRRPVAARGPASPASPASPAPAASEPAADQP